jgi:hypothetical protein
MTDKKEDKKEETKADVKEDKAKGSESPGFDVNDALGQAKEVAGMLGKVATRLFGAAKDIVQEEMKSKSSAKVDKKPSKEVKEKKKDSEKDKK